jgi:hypothetical protein
MQKLKEELQIYGEKKARSEARINKESRCKAAKLLCI